LLEQLIARTTETMISVQEERKKDQEHKILHWFTLPQRLHPILCQPVKISTNQDQLTSIQTLATSKNSLLPTANKTLQQLSNIAEPTALNQLQLQSLCNS